MNKAKELVSKHWKPLLALAATGAAGYFGGPAAAELVQKLITSLLGA